MDPFAPLQSAASAASNFSWLMENWMDVVTSPSFMAADSTKSDGSGNAFSMSGTSSGASPKLSTTQTVISDKKSSSSSSSSGSSPLSLADDGGSKSSSSSSKSSSRKSGRSKKNSKGKSNTGSGNGSSNKKKKNISSSGRKRSGGLLPTYEVIGNTSSDLIMELQHGNEGFDMHISQNVCDDSRPVAGKEAECYFLMRHSFQYPGPWMTMMQGPAAASGGGGGAYRVSAEAVHKDKYVLVGTYNNNTVEGVWEQTWNKYIKSQVTFIAGFLSPQQRQMQMLMGASGGPKFPSLVGYTDFRFENWAAKMRIDMMNNEMSFSLNRKIMDNLMVGSRIATTYDQRKTMMEFGAKYTWFSNSGNASGMSSDASGSSGDSSDESKKSKQGSRNTIEALFHKDSLMAQLFYTKQITDNAALTSRLMWAVGTTDRIMTSVGYKYQFGRHQGMAKVICGEISSDGCIRQSLTFPLLTNMLVKLHAEMNHFLTPERMQRGEFPHKFGISLNIHL